eukprot:scaffold205263_cov20-Tisochrysis_lutea.AAC.2
MRNWTNPTRSIKQALGSGFSLWGTFEHTPDACRWHSCLCGSRGGEQPQRMLQKHMLKGRSAFMGPWQLHGWWAAQMKKALRGWWAAQMLMATRTDHPSASSSSSGSSGSGTFEAGPPHPTWQGTLLGFGRLGCIIWAAQALAGGMTASGRDDDDDDGVMN